MTWNPISSRQPLVSSPSKNSDGACRPTPDPAPHGTGGALLAAYLVYVLLFGLTPFTFSVGESGSIGLLFSDRFQGLSGLAHLTFWDIWTNILLYIPCGLLVVLLPRVATRAWPAKILMASAAATLLSSGIEVAQLFLPRAPSVADIVCNTLGSVIGGALGIGVHTFLQTRGSGWIHLLRRHTVLPAILAGYILLLFVTLVLPLPLARDFSNWNSTYHLFLGNEGTMNRSWRGSLYLVALYDRALTPEEISRNFSMGPFVDLREEHKGHGLIAHYDFSESGGEVIHDHAEAGAPLDLQIRDSSRVKWMKPRGLTLGQGAVVSSVNPPTKLVEGRFASHSELSVEAWVAPADLAQSGPARIVSYSIDPGERNFTLGQQNGEVVFRLRTPVSGLNGARPTLRTNDSSLDLTTQHLVVTYRDGVETLYLNGTVHATALLRSLDSASDWVVQRVGVSFTWLIHSVLIFPLGILCSHLFWQHSTWKVRWFSFGTAFLALLGIQGLRMLTFETAFDPSGMLVGTSTLLISVFLLPPSQPRIISSRLDELCSKESITTSPHGS